MARLFGIFLLLVSTAISPASAQDVTANTPLGGLVGEVVTAEGRSVSEFRGVPYALPPVRERRWKPAEVLSQPWNGARQAKVAAPACMQPQSFSSASVTRNMSEDCLYLNISTPANVAAEKLDSLPVMVWIHGGSLLNGAAPTDGAKLASKGVVVVSIAYRVGVFGYFAHPELTAESPHRASGNYGTTDQVAALKWVQSNIAAFGGDPGNVTVFGLSAGAYSTLQLVASPLAKGLFHRAISHSGYLKFLQPLKKPGHSLPSAEQSGVKFARAAHASSLAQLRSMPGQKLLDVINVYKDVYDVIPDVVLDGWVFPAQLFDIFEQGKQNNVPIMIGSTSNEQHRLLTGRDDWKNVVPKSAAEYRSMITSRYGERADEYFSLYPAGDFTSIDDPRWLASMRDSFYGFPAQKIARDSARISSNVFLYYFDQWSPWQGKAGPYHGSDTPYIFNSWDEKNPTDSDIRLTSIMQNYWVAFAKSGAPNATGQPRWSPYSDGSRAYMAFRDGMAVPGKNLLPGMLEFWDVQFRERWAEGKQPWTVTSIGAYAPEKHAGDTPP